MPTDVPPSDHADLVRASFAAFERRDLAALQALCTTEVEFVSVTGRIGGTGEVYRGHRGLDHYFADALRTWETLKLDPEVIEEVDADLITVKGRVRAWGSGHVIDGSASWVFRMSRGRIAEIHAFDSRDAADAALPALRHR